MSRLYLPHAAPSAHRVWSRAGMAVLTGLTSVAVLAAAAPSQAAGIHSGHLSQGAADHLYVTNTKSDDISVFSLSDTGRPIPEGMRVASGAQPRGIVFTPDGSTAYVVNTGVNTVTAYAVNEHGTPSPLATAATGGEEPFGLAFAPNGRSLYVTNASSGTVSAFRVNDDRTLDLLGAPVDSGASDPRGVVVTPNGRFLYVGHGRPNAGPSDVVTAFAIRDDGSLRRVGAPVRTGGAGTGMVTSPDGRFLYVVCTNSDEVFAFSIKPDGSLDQSASSPFRVADFPEGAAITPDGRHLYVTSPGPDRTQPGHAVSAFTVNPDGSLTPVVGSPFTAGDGPVGVAITPDARRLYATNFDSNDVSAFDITSSGGLREIEGSPVPTGGEGPGFQSVAIRPAP